VSLINLYWYCEDEWEKWDSAAFTRDVMLRRKCRMTYFSNMASSRSFVTYNDEKGVTRSNCKGIWPLKHT
jgi:hypothetical protein